MDTRGWRCNFPKSGRGGCPNRTSGKYTPVPAVRVTVHAFAGIDIEGDFLDHLGSKLIASVRSFDFEEVGDNPEYARLRLP